MTCEQNNSPMEKTLRKLVRVITSTMSLNIVYRCITEVNVHLLVIFLDVADCILMAMHDL